MTITIGVYHFYYVIIVLNMKNVTKKILATFFALIAVFAFVKTYAADTGSNLLDALAGDNSTWAASITTTGANATSIKIEFPIFVSNNEQIMNYAVSYVKGKSIANADLTDIKKSTFEGDKVVVENGKATLLLDTLSASSTYNFVVTPINKEWTELDPSDEMSFQTTAESAMQNTDQSWIMNDTSVTNETMMGSADTASANFTYVVSNSTVTVKWQPIAGATKFAFSMKETIDPAYTNVGEEVITKGTYSFLIGKKWLYTVKIVPEDANGSVVWVEKNLSIKIDTISATPGKGTPATGAWLNIILMSTFLMMLIYVVYRFRTTK